MAKIYSQDTVIKFAESFASCKTDFKEARERFMADLVPGQRDLFIKEYNRLKAPEKPIQTQLFKSEPYKFKK
jgi:hypothetical protein